MKQLYIKPVDGTITKQWSGEDLVWSETLGDYRVHTGCDIAAAVGSKVRAMADGEVSDIYCDDLLGYVVEIDQQCRYTQHMGEGNIDVRRDRL